LALFSFELIIERNLRKKTESGINPGKIKAPVNLNSLPSVYSDTQNPGFGTYLKTPWPFYNDHGAERKDSVFYESNDGIPESS